MALIAAHLNVGVFLVVSVAIGIFNVLLPPPLPVPNKPYSFCGR